MLTLEELITEAIALSEPDKTTLLDRVAESMSEHLDQAALSEGVRKAQVRIAEIDSGTVQTIPGETALAQIRQAYKS
ncbi:MAG: addiction module protein [Cyanobacteria bacterium J06623_5]